MANFFRDTWTKLYLRREDNINYPTHIHDEIELAYVIRGGGKAFCDGTQYTLSAGSIFISYPGQIHGFSECVPGEYILLIINPARLLHLEHSFRNQIPSTALTASTQEIVQPLLDALKELNAHGDSYIIDGYLTAFLGKLHRSMVFQRSADMNKTISQILHYCSQNYREPITIPDLCQALHVSQSHISHIFSQRLKISFPDYMNALRLNRAILLLHDPKLSITQVVERAGFPTIRTFNRVFRKQFGCSPTEYRAKQTKE